MEFNYLMILQLVLAIGSYVGLALIFKKANEAWWKALIPIYNTVIVFKIIGLNPWLVLTLLIPFVNIVVVCIVCNGLAKAFGHGTGFTLGLFFFTPIFQLILGLNQDEYLGPQF